MICEDLDRDISTLEIRLPSFESIDDSEEFFVIDLVVAFSGTKVLAIERNGVEDVIVIIL